MQKTVERIPVWKMVMYSLGQFGWSLLSAVATLLTYFYIPPETGEAAFPLLVTREAVFGMTVVGVSGFLAQAVGLFFDPLMGALSDRSKSRFGRRTLFSAHKLAAAGNNLLSHIQPAIVRTRQAQCGMGGIRGCAFQYIHVRLQDALRRPHSRTGTHFKGQDAAVHGHIRHMGAGLSGWRLAYL